MVRVVVLVAVGLVVFGVLAGRGSRAVAQESLSISGMLWLDEDGDGLHEAGEAPMKRIGVSLLRSGVVVTSVQTDDFGVYPFDGLQPGEYAVQAQDFYGLSIETVPARRLAPPFVQAVTLGSVSLTAVDFGFYFFHRQPAFVGLVFANATLWTFRRFVLSSMARTAHSRA